MKEKSIKVELSIKGKPYYGELIDQQYSFIKGIKPNEVIVNGQDENKEITGLMTLLSEQKARDLVASEDGWGNIFNDDPDALLVVSANYFMDQTEIYTNDGCFDTVLIVLLIILMKYEPDDLKSTNFFIDAYDYTIKNKNGDSVQLPTTNKGVLWFDFEKELLSLFK